MKKVLVLILVVFILALFITFYGNQLIDSQNPQNEAIINYLNVPFYEPSIDFLEEDEQAHMKDVKIIFNITFILLIICFAGLYFLKLDLKSMKFAGISILGIELFCILSILIGDFSWAFDVFHKIFFPQGNYSFPVESTLIQLYPESYFFGMTVSICVISTIFTVLLIFSEKIYKFLSKKTN